MWWQAPSNTHYENHGDTSITHVARDQGERPHFIQQTYVPLARFLFNNSQRNFDIMYQLSPYTPISCFFFTLEIVERQPSQGLYSPGQKLIQAVMNLQPLMVRNEPAYVPLLTHLQAVSVLSKIVVVPGLVQWNRFTLLR